jgi:hypothetical protein
MKVTNSSRVKSFFSRGSHSSTKSFFVQGFLKDVGIEAVLKIQKYGVYMATTVQGKYAGLVRGPCGIAWEPDSLWSAQTMSRRLLLKPVCVVQAAKDQSGNHLHMPVAIGAEPLHKSDNTWQAVRLLSR